MWASERLRNASTSTSNLAQIRETCDLEIPESIPAPRPSANSNASSPTVSPVTAPATTRAQSKGWVRRCPRPYDSEPMSSRLADDGQGMPAPRLRMAVR